MKSFDRGHTFITLSKTLRNCVVVVAKTLAAKVRMIKFC